MKRIFSVALSLIMLVMLGVMFGGCSTSGSKGLAYALSSDQSYAIFMGSGEATDEHLVISDTYKDKPVTEIATNAINDAHGELPYKSITLPATITQVNFNAISITKTSVVIKFKGSQNQFNKIEGRQYLGTVQCLG